MSPEVRAALVTASICTAIIYAAFLVGWLFRDRLGVPRSQLKSWWVVLLVGPVTLGSLLVLLAYLPSWARGAFGTLTALVLVWAEPRYRAWVERADPLRGREGRVISAPLDPLQVEVDGEVWHARPEGEQVFLRDQRVRVQSRDRTLLVVGRS